MSFAAMILIACVLDIVIGWPDWLYKKIGHPVTWVGRVISGFESRLNHGSDRQRFWSGAFTTALVIVLVGGVAWVLQAALPQGVVEMILGGILAWPFVALRSMHDHVKGVFDPLNAGDLERARDVVSKIVGRDPNQLGPDGIARGALESLAENTSDGIVAPVFWGVIGGLPGIAIYKAVNTLDSMIGHRNEQYEQFGKVAARLDDLLNLIPARLTGLLFAVVSNRPARALKVMFRDASQHRSPNAGWPESAMAGALSIRLSGPRVYGDRVAQEPWLNADAPDPKAGDINAGLRLYRRAMVAMIVVLCLCVGMGV